MINFTLGVMMPMNIVMIVSVAAPNGTSGGVLGAFQDLSPCFPLACRVEKTRNTWGLHVNTTAEKMDEIRAFEAARYEEQDEATWLDNATTTAYVDSSGSEFGPKVVSVINKATVRVVSGNGCDDTTITEVLTGKVAVITRGSCTFVEMVKAVQAKGAVAVIIVNNGLFGVHSVMEGTDAAVTIPARLIDGDVGKAFFGCGYSYIGCRGGSGTTSRIAVIFPEGVAVSITSNPDTKPDKKPDTKTLPGSADDIYASITPFLAILGVFYANWTSRKLERNKEKMSSWGDVENMSLSEFETKFGDEARICIRLGWKGCCGCSNPRHGACIGAWERPITEKEFEGEVKEAVRVLRGKPTMWKMVILPFLSLVIILEAFLFSVIMKFLVGWKGFLPLGDFLLNTFLKAILIGWGQVLATVIVLYFLKMYVCKRCCRKKTNVVVDGQGTTEGGGTAEIGAGDAKVDLTVPAATPTHEGGAGLGEQTMTRDPRQEADGEV